MAAIKNDYAKNCTPLTKASPNNVSGRDEMKVENLPRAHMRMALAGLTTALACSVSGVAFAQSNATDNAANADKAAADTEIIVTAQRREQRLQDVPLAISAVGSEQLADRGVTDISAMSSVVPSLSISGNAGNGGFRLLSIRGLSGQAVPIGQSQTVAVYLDGEYLPKPDAAFFALDDIERLEVLRGPQGTLYGRNATGGAINIITRMPGDQLQGGHRRELRQFQPPSHQGFTERTAWRGLQCRNFWKL
jgi:iron complex outermembrane receptor protein